MTVMKKEMRMKMKMMTVMIIKLVSTFFLFLSPFLLLFFVISFRSSFG